MNRRFTPWEEHEFWLRILRDHAYFVYDYLSPKEKYWTQMAKAYIDQFTWLRKHLKQLPKNAPVSSAEMILLANQIYPIACKYYHYEGRIQHLRIYNQIQFNLPPTYFNGTLDENAEYLRLLEYYLHGQNPPLLPFERFLDLWLFDQEGHALLLIHGLDSTEEELMDQVRKVVLKFRYYQLKNKQFAGYMRFTRPLFPAQVKFVHQIIRDVSAFTQLVSKVVHQYKDNKVINSLSLRFLEHHFPESCYFLHKLMLYLPEEERENIDCSLYPPYFYWNTI
ncbi:DUF2935 domain-containing protein [Thermoflavimicrobium daqui]|uniref:DUF2935 domain-containing protein n=1 Tax=Thermoflavimicrobium daqui TaxID=2137476 RepID=A0A364K1W8_9BACL|nr:DUF2935 domain-containing protein [Thermoflavimicrobium daqui]RAL22028.1 hypothetical protein DL897_14550 [Thermoflavimicrobium daqui]